MTQPAPLRQPIAPSASTHIRAAESAISRADTMVDVDNQVKRTRDRLERLENMGHRQTQLKAKALRRLERAAEEKKRELHTKNSTAAGKTEKPAKLLARRSLDTPTDVIEKWAAKPNELLSPIVQQALTEPSHWLHREYVDRVMQHVLYNESIPRSYKEQLPLDVAEVLKVTPDVLGLVKESTYRGQRGPLSSHGKLGSGTGSVYEIMGVASLIRRSSTAKNTGAKLRITAGIDRVDFCNKLQAGYPVKGLEISRKTVEADAQIWRSGREISIDFKHAKGGRSYSAKQGKAELEQQVHGVMNALRTGEAHEFHFVTNGHFSKGFMKVIDKANESLVDSGIEPIACHEHVHSVPA